MNRSLVVWLVTWLAAWLATVSLPAWAQPLQDASKQACADAYDNSQVLRDQGKRELARAQLEVCQRACPEKLANDCAAWLSELEAHLPSVVLAARDAKERPVDALVSIDGQPAEPVTSRAVRLERGRHVFRFEQSADGAVEEVTVELGGGEQERHVVVRFGSESDDEIGMPVSDAAAIGLGVVGGAALVAAGALAIKGHLDKSALFDCKPNCAQDDVNAVARTWTASGIVAGVGGAVLAAALVVWLVGDEPDAKASDSGAGIRFGAEGLRFGF